MPGGVGAGTFWTGMVDNAGGKDAGAVAAAGWHQFGRGSVLGFLVALEPVGAERPAQRRQVCRHTGQLGLDIFTDVVESALTGLVSAGTDGPIAGFGGPAFGANSIVAFFAQPALVPPEVLEVFQDVQGTIANEAAETFTQEFEASADSTSAHL